MVNIRPYLLSSFFLAFFLNLPAAEAQTELEIRKKFLQEIIQLQEKPTSHDGFVSYHDSTWVDWVKRTGDLPPNFKAMPSIPFLPDPLVLDEGGKNQAVTSKAQWETQRDYIKGQVIKLFSGTFPDPPDNLKIKVLEEKTENRVKIRKVELQFGENHQGKLSLEIFIPQGDGPFPVFLTQWNHRGWAQVAVRRGYIGIIYAGADTMDDTRDYLKLYPDFDWTTLMTRAWGAHRAVDYLYTLAEVDRSKIALAGHSRNGKQSLFAAAFDNRIKAVITSSGGTGGEFPYRYTDERHANESIEYLVSRRTHWLHPRLRFYAGREHKLPIDQNSLMALIAPNSLLLSSSIREGGGGDPWAIEQIYASLSQVYSFLGVPEKLGIRLRDGEHAVSERDIEAYIDWLDIQFNINNIPWENKLYYNYTFKNWKEKSKENLDLKDFPDLSAQNGLSKIPGNGMDWMERNEFVKKQINWILGDEPPGVAAHKIESLSQQEDYVSSFMERPIVKNGKKENIAPYNAIGDYLYGSLYYPTDPQGKKITGKNGKMPVVIYLHKYSNTGYDVSLNALFEAILSKGIAVLAMDLIGYGARIEEGTLFYQRYPHWSKMGKMVTDTQAAVDALESLEFIDSKKIYLAGYALGGTVAIFTSALEPKIAGLAVASAFTPLRKASDHVEGHKTYSHLYGLIPRLGFFDGHIEKIPIDFKEILAAIAPRHLLLIAPQLDRHADHEHILKEMEEVQKVYQIMDSRDKFEIQSPYEFNHFTKSQQEEMVKWLDKINGQN